MTRKKRNFNRNLIKADLKYNSLLVARIINGLTRSGNKSKSIKIIYSVLKLIRIKYLVNPLSILDVVFNTIKPCLNIRFKKVGGSGYIIPFKINDFRSIGLVIKWIRELVLSRGNISVVKYLFMEFINAFNGVGILISKKNSLYKIALHNRAFFYL